VQGTAVHESAAVELVETLAEIMPLAAAAIDVAECVPSTDAATAQPIDATAAESAGKSASDRLVCRICEESIAPSEMRAHSEWCLQVCLDV
jgi:hypothetical protein